MPCKECFVPTISDGVCGVCSEKIYEDYSQLLDHVTGLRNKIAEVEQILNKHLRNKGRNAVDMLNGTELRLMEYVKEIEEISLVIKKLS